MSGLILNSPYAEPAWHWEHRPGTVSLTKVEGRRAPGYTKFNTKSRGDGEFVHLEAVAVIRERVKAWRAAGWPGITPVTRQLLERWCGVGQEEGVVEPRPFFCQLEAIETLIWLTEGAEAERQGLWGMFDGQLQGDGGPFERVCTKTLHGRRQDEGDGHAHRLARVQQGNLSARQAVLPGLLDCGAEPDGARPPGWVGPGDGWRGV